MKKENDFVIIELSYNRKNISFKFIVNGFKKTIKTVLIKTFTMLIIHELRARASISIDLRHQLRLFVQCSANKLAQCTFQ